MSDQVYTFPKEHSRETYLEGFWGWGSLMASGVYDLAASSLESSGFTAETLRERVETLFGGEQRLSVVIPERWNVSHPGRPRRGRRE